MLMPNSRDCVKKAWSARIGIGSNLPGADEICSTCASFDAFLLAGCYTLLDRSGATLIDDASRARRSRSWPAAYSTRACWRRWPQSAPTFGYQPAGAAIVEHTQRIAASLRPPRRSAGAAALQYRAGESGNHDGVDRSPNRRRARGESGGRRTALFPPMLWSDLAAPARFSRLTARDLRAVTALYCRICASTPIFTSGSPHAGSTTGPSPTMLLIVAISCRRRDARPRRVPHRRRHPRADRAANRGDRLVDRPRGETASHLGRHCVGRPGRTAVAISLRCGARPKVVGIRAQLRRVADTAFVTRPAVVANLAAALSAGLNVTVLAEARHYLHLARARAPA